MLLQDRLYASRTDPIRYAFIEGILAAKRGVRAQWRPFKTGSERRCGDADREICRGKTVQTPRYEKLRLGSCRRQRAGIGGLGASIAPGRYGKGGSAGDA